VDLEYYPNLPFSTGQYQCFSAEELAKQHPRKAYPAVMQSQLLGRGDSSARPVRNSLLKADANQLISIVESGLRQTWIKTGRKGHQVDMSETFDFIVVGGGSALQHG
jgi:hypothetical protein